MNITGRTFIRFCGALLLGLGATAIDHPRGLEWLTSRRVRTAPVVVAAKDLPEGQPIDRTSVAIAMWPVPTIPAGALASVDSVVNRVARTNVFKGEALVPGRLAPEGASVGLQVRITPGKRAFAIRINEMSGVGGVIEPNSRVDVMLVIDRPNDAGKRVARLIMSNMRVLAIGPVIEAAADGRPVEGTVATLEVTPEEAERLAIAATQGQIQLVLRGKLQLDSLTADRTIITRDLLLRHYEPKAARPD